MNCCFQFFPNISLKFSKGSILQDKKQHLDSCLFGPWKVEVTAVHFSKVAVFLVTSSHFDISSILFLKIESIEIEVELMIKR